MFNDELLTIKWKKNVIVV